MHRHLSPRVEQLLAQFPAVVILGARQVGKATLARSLASSRDCIYLDLKLASDRAKLMDPGYDLSAHVDRLVILDGVQRMPELFSALRGIINTGSWEGNGNGRFLLLGCASGRLLAQQSESLAGRAVYVKLHPLAVT